MELRMYEVVALMAKGKIKNGAKLYVANPFDVEEFTYQEVKKEYYDESYFVSEFGNRLNGFSDIEFLKDWVTLCNPDEIEYYIKVNISGLAEDKSYLNYTFKNDKCELSFGYKQRGVFIQTTFTMSGMKEYREIREFLADMEGRYELIEVEKPQQKKDKEKEEVELDEGFGRDMEELFTTDILDIFGGEENEVD